MSNIRQLAGDEIDFGSTEAGDSTHPDQIASTKKANGLSALPVDLGNAERTGPDFEQPRVPATPPLARAAEGITWMSTTAETQRLSRAGSEMLRSREKELVKSISLARRHFAFFLA